MTNMQNGLVDKSFIHSNKFENIRKGWTIVTKKEIVALYNQVVNEAIKYGWYNSANDAPKLFKTSRLTKALGRCVTRYDLIRHAYNSVIVLNKNYIDMANTTDILTLLCHELAHALTPSDSHNANWKAVADILGSKWGIIATKYASENETLLNYEKNKAEHKKSKLMWGLRCTKCGKIMSRKYATYCNKLKNARLYYHVPCGSDATLEVIPIN